MAATELLDYNQAGAIPCYCIRSSAAGLSFGSSARTRTQRDPSQSFFAMDVTIENYGTLLLPLVLVRLGPLLLPTTSLVVRTCGPFSLCAALMALAT